MEKEEFLVFSLATLPTGRSTPSCASLADSRAPRRVYEHVIYNGRLSSASARDTLLHSRSCTPTATPWEPWCSLDAG